MAPFLTLQVANSGYITASTYEDIDWHNSCIIYEQLKSNGSYNIGKEVVLEVIAKDIAKDSPI